MHRTRKLICIVARARQLNANAIEARDRGLIKARLRWMDLVA
jgi:regulator of sirC expression with transglutaminase-like and TPR domain